MVYKLDLRELWSKDTKVRTTAMNRLENRKLTYSKLIEVLEKSIEQNRFCTVKFKDETYKFENMPVDVIYIVLIDYWQARSFKLTEDDEDDLNLDLVKDFVEIIWKLELAARRYWQDVVKVAEHVNAFIDVTPEGMVHDEVEHEVHLGSFLADYRNGFVELKMFINRIIEFFC
jgi:hypothetical protein